MTRGVRVAGLVTVLWLFCLPGKARLSRWMIVSLPRNN